MVQTIHFRDCPLFSVCGDGRRIVTSGGGGGAKFGIENLVECFEVDSAEGGRLAVVASEPRPMVIDGIRYSPQINTFCGGLGKNCILFRFIPRTDGKSIFETCGTWQTVASPTEGASRQISGRVQDHCDISRSGRLVATTGEDGSLSLYSLTPCEVTTSTSERTTTCGQTDSSGGGSGGGSGGECESPHADRCEYTPHLLGTLGDLHKEGTLSDICFTPDDKYVFTCGKDGSVKVVDVKLCACITSTTIPNPDLSNVKLMPKSVRVLGSGSPNVLTPKPSSSSEASATYTVLMSAHGQGKISYLIKWAVTVATTQSSAIGSSWRMVKHCKLKNVPMLNCIATSSNEELVAAASNTHIWILHTSTLDTILCTRRGANGEYFDLPPTGLAFTNSDTRLIVGAADYTIAVVDVNKSSMLLLGLKNTTHAFWAVLLLAVIVCSLMLERHFLFSERI